MARRDGYGDDNDGFADGERLDSQIMVTDSNHNGEALTSNNFAFPPLNRDIDGLLSGRASRDGENLGGWSESSPFRHE